MSSANTSSADPRLGTLRPPGERPGRTPPKPRPFFASVVRGLFKLFSWLSLPTLHRLGGGIGWLLWRFPTRERRTTLANLALAYPDSDSVERERIARKSLIEDGKMMIEHAALWTWPQERVLGLIHEVHGAEHLRDAIDSGRGAILAATHLGAIEALCIYCSSHYEFRAQYRAPRVQELDAFFRHARERFGAKLLPTGKSSVRLLLTSLKEGKLLGIPCDQDSGEGAGIFVPFFGRLANTMTLISRLAAKANPLVVVGYSERLPNGKGYNVHFVPVPAELYESDLVTSASALNATVEACIRRCPDQYLWSYKRFRVRPPKVQP